jgi:uracil-DNA glycosylase
MLRFRMTVRIHPSWHAALAPEFEKPYWAQLTAFVKAEYAAGPCFPPGRLILRAFDATPFDAVKVVILGQDPYHTPRAAMGLSFSVPEGSRAQPSLQNIFKELATDVGGARTSTDLSDWAAQGVLLLNAVLTVRQGSPASHAKQGWETLTDAVIQTLSEQREGLVFVLWGAYSMSKRSLIDATHHKVLTSAHPSPFSAYKGFLGSKPFSNANAYLRSRGVAEIDWVGGG